MGEGEIDLIENRRSTRLLPRALRATTPEDEETTVELLLLRQELPVKDERLVNFQQEPDRQRLFYGVPDT
jgi:hypothetical protein